jgi:hypothetical protein
MDDIPQQGRRALAEAHWLQEMFEGLALAAAERRIAHSLDFNDIAKTMFFLDVYHYVNGGDVLGAGPAKPPEQAGRAAND